ncbi:mitochondrial translation release factor in rescue-like [Oppia nitens]|uniref:mitochondrial translation release factor in rescue-like n=1 Tax=Oppia nitens TaxID=1686743 RepID=UPI0023DCE457|nr:mitochondrial translation release factor in rescue-like [Oppia nitens]
MSTIITRVVNKQLLLFNSTSYPSINQLVSNYLSTTSAVLLSIKIDKSRVPVIDENDLKEVFIHGGGPGGQKVNKAHNCVQLTHLPTGIVVKVHHHREQQRNRIVARELLRTKLDNLINGDQSVSAQRHQLITDRYARRDQKREKVRQLKAEFKQRGEEKQQREE